VTSLEVRKSFAGRAFGVTNRYDNAIGGWLRGEEEGVAGWLGAGRPLRYGENPHQSGAFHGDLEKLLEQLHGKELSYNNLLDIDAAVQLMSEFTRHPAAAVIKHNNACGVAERPTLLEAWNAALAGDPVSAFGGVLIFNRAVDAATAEAMDGLFFEVAIAPDFTEEALAILKQKKNRMVLKWKPQALPALVVRSALNGFLVENRDTHSDSVSDFRTVTQAAPTALEIDDLVVASAICKHTKSNTIVLVKNGQLLGSGTGQTSRVDALEQAIHKAKTFNFDLNGAVMASDAFFPFPDCVEIAHKAGISAVVQPGGSVKDQLSIDYCDAQGLSMVFTGIRHFKH
jgi:phosphoribosylaminoimidazolecarboxamide formyltransferase/IMP cyclohydrolase